MLANDLSPLRSLFEASNHISLVLPQRASFDIVAASLGLKLVLDHSGKQTRVVSPDAVLVEFNRLVGIDTVVDTFGGRNLVISFPGQTEHVDKVSYNLEKGELQLVITPKNTAPDLDYQKLKFVAGSSKTDLVVYLGVKSHQDLGPIAAQINEHAAGVQSVSISHEESFQPIANHHFHDVSSPSLSQVVAHIAKDLGLAFDADSATNLLAGIEKATRNFTHHQVTASTFEAAFLLMNHGAVRHSELSPSDYPVGSIPTLHSVPTPPPVVSSFQGYGTDSAPAVEPPPPLSKPPADWYEPKVFKGPMLP